MKNIEVIYKGIRYSFSDGFSFKRIQKIIEEYPYPSKIPNTATWWYRKTDFGVYLLNKIKLSIEALPKDKIKNSDWKLFRPVLRAYFPSMTENRRASVNLQFILGNYPTPLDDYYFMKYLILSKFGKLRSEELDEMKYKEAMMLYKYIVGELIMRNAALNLMKDNITQQEEKQEEKQSGMVT